MSPEDHQFLKEFVEEERPTIKASGLLALVRQERPPKGKVTFHFNRFNVFAMPEKKEIRIEDDIGMSMIEECTVTYSDFLSTYEKLA